MVPHGHKPIAHYSCVCFTNEARLRANNPALMFVIKTAGCTLTDRLYFALIFGISLSSNDEIPSTRNVMATSHGDQSLTAPQLVY